MYLCALLTHIVSIDQATDCLQWAESVILAIVLTTARIPDQVAALLKGQDICCGSLRKKNIRKLSVATEDLKAPRYFYIHVHTRETPLISFIY